MPTPSQDLRMSFVPAPIGGWNTRDPLWDMPNSDARYIENIFPGTSSCRLRGGSTEFADIGSPTIDKLYEHVNINGTRQFVAVSANDVVKITSGGAGTNITPAGYVASDPPWTFVSFNDYLIASNLGTGKAWTWDGVAANGVLLAVTTGPTNAQVGYVTSYNSRLYFTKKSTASVYYGDPDQITGFTFTEFPYGSLLRKGGTIVAIGSTSVTNGYFIQTFFVAVSSMGEVIVHQGDYPGDSTWTLAARFSIAPPFGSSDCLFYVGNDLNIITQRGPIAMSQLMGGVDIDNPYLVTAGKIEKAFLDASVSASSSTRWQGIYWNRDPYVLILVPGASTNQYVMNNITKAWCNYTGWDAYCWSLFNNDLYFGTTSGKVYKADLLGTADAANSNTISYRYGNAYTDLGSPNLVKTTSFAQPIFLAKSSALAGTSVGFYIRQNIDFDETTNNLTTGSSFCGASSLQLNNVRYGVAGAGQWIGVGLEGGYTAGATAEFYGINYYTKMGGP